MSKYISLTFVEDYTGLSFTADTVPSLSQVQDYIDIAESEFDARYGDMAGSTQVEEIVERIGNTLFLSNVPISSIVSLERNTADVFSPVWEAVSTDDFVIRDDKVVIKSSGREFRVTYVPGYQSIPLFLKEIVVLMVMEKSFINDFLRVGGSPGGKQVVVDADVYRSITGGGSIYQGIGDLKSLVDSKVSLLPKPVRKRGVLL